MVRALPPGPPLPPLVQAGLIWLMPLRFAVHQIDHRAEARNPQGEPVAVAPVTAVQQDVWLDAVCKESLRSRPVVWQIGRKLTEPVELAGYQLPAGTMVAPAINLVHHDERYYPEPEEFRPQRFLDQRADTSVWLPFGGGIRRCLGATFAQVEMRTVLREVLRRVELAPTAAPEEPVRVRHVTLVPRQGAMVTVRRHLAVAAAAEHIVTTSRDQ